jgi:hypothetical protein
MPPFLFLVFLASCGSVNTNGGVDALPAPDATPCPSDTVPVSSAPGSACIERHERGTAEWDAASTTCLGIGRRLCTDDEWSAACATASGLDNMIDDDAGMNLAWEWVDQQADGIAHQRGYTTCDDANDDAIAEPTDYRCCVDR